MSWGRIEFAIDTVLSRRAESRFHREVVLERHCPSRILALAPARLGPVAPKRAPSPRNCGRHGVCGAARPVPGSFDLRSTLRAARATRFRARNGRCRADADARRGERFLGPGAAVMERCTTSTRRTGRDRERRGLPSDRARQRGQHDAVSTSARGPARLRFDRRRAPPGTVRFPRTPGPMATSCSSTCAGQS